jgi:hypothetical protein
MDIHGSIHGCGYPWILPSKHIHMDVVRAIHGYPTGYPSTAITDLVSLKSMLAGSLTMSEL